MGKNLFFIKTLFYQILNLYFLISWINLLVIYAILSLYRDSSFLPVSISIYSYLKYSHNFLNVVGTTCFLVYNYVFLVLFFSVLLTILQTIALSLWISKTESLWFSIVLVLYNSFLVWLAHLLWFLVFW